MADRQKMSDGPLPVWQRALLARGCEVQKAGQFFPMELQPIGDRIYCTPSVSGALVPFNVRVKIDQTIIITWDSERSRYIVTGAGNPVAA